MTYRITYYLDNPASRCAYLREAVGDFQTHENSPYVIVAREYDENNKVTRAWFLSLHQMSDGTNPPYHDNPPTHKVVSSRIAPGEESKPPDPMVRVSNDLQPVLQRLKQQQIKDASAIKAHTEFCRTYNEAVAKAAEWKSNVEHLNRVVAEKDSTIMGYRSRLVEITAGLNATRQELRAERKRRTIAHRIRLWAESVRRHVSWIRQR